TLVGVEVEKERAALRMRPVVRKRTALPGRVPLTRLFHFEHFGTKVSHHLGTEWSGHHLGQLDDPEITQGAFRHGITSFSTLRFTCGDYISLLRRGCQSGHLLIFYTANA